MSALYANDAAKRRAHHAAPPRGPLRYELHRGGKVASRHATVVGMLLAKLDGGGK
jgi:hypothetical protein